MLQHLAFAIAAVLGGEGLLRNPDFEAQPSEKDPVPGWVLELGAQNGAQEPRSMVEIDGETRHGGNASVHFAGDENTRGWIIAKQEIEVRPGGTYQLQAWTRTAGVRPNGFGLDNCYVGLIFFDGDGEVVGRQFEFPRLPDADWKKQEVRLTATAAARKGYVYLFLSMIGDFWIDDLELEIKGGKELPGLELVFREDFAAAKKLPSGWKTEIGATNGPQRTGSKDSVVEVDLELGALESPRSLKLAGDADTLRWRTVGRELDAAPGDLFRLKTLVRAREVRREGNQFENLHASLVFLDRKGEPIGPPRFANARPGTFDWTELVIEGIAPEATKKVRAGLFLSMSGEAWFDDVELHRQQGLPPPYADWSTFEAEGIVLRSAKDHPHAAEMKAYANRLTQAKDEICRRLELEFPETITVFLYKDLDQGRLLTGGTLDFADPAQRRVHQRWESFIGHEMVHVIAHTTLQNAGTPLLGEGIAVWLNGQPEEAHHRRAAEIQAQGKLPAVADLVQGLREQDRAYPAAGSFCGFLIETHGLEVFKELYPLEDPSARLLELAGASFLDLEPAWHEHLKEFR